eukprot:1003300_1
MHKWIANDANKTLMFYDEFDDAYIINKTNVIQVLLPTMNTSSCIIQTNTMPMRPHTNEYNANVIIQTNTCIIKSNLHYTQMMNPHLHWLLTKQMRTSHAAIRTIRITRNILRIIRMCTDSNDE